MSVSPLFTPDISVVLPVYNEQENLPGLHGRLEGVFGAMQKAYELIFVDDGSRDRSYEILRQLARSDPNVRVLKLSRNFGHHLAITAGLDHAKGNAVVLMDSDLQDLPEEIPKLYDRLEQGYGMVVALRQHKQFSWFKRATSALFRWTMKRVFSYELSGGIFRIMRREVVEQVRRCRETDRLVDGLIAWTGFRQSSVSVQHGARPTGQSSYTLRKQVRLALNALTAFSTLPLKLASWLGFAISAVSFLGISWIIYRRLVSNLGVVGWSSLFVLVSFLGGVQLLCIGVLGEYVGRIFNETRQRPLYVIESDLSARDNARSTDDPGQDRDADNDRTSRPRSGAAVAQ